LIAIDELFNQKFLYYTDYLIDTQLIADCSENSLLLNASQNFWGQTKLQPEPEGLKMLKILANKLTLSELNF